MIAPAKPENDTSLLHTTLLKSVPIEQESTDVVTKGKASSPETPPDMSAPSKPSTSNANSSYPWENGKEIVGFGDNVDPVMDEPTTSKPGSKTVAVAMAIVFLVLAILFLLWVLLGVLGYMTAMSIPDLGYSWFNQNVFSLF